MPDEIRNLTQEQVIKWLSSEEAEFNVEHIRRKYNIDADSGIFKMTISRLTSGELGLLDGSTLKRLGWGKYRRVSPIQPIKWWNGEEKERIPIVWPCSHSDVDYSLFGFEDTIEIFPGDTILIAGDSNWGKTALAQNLLVDNLHLFEDARLMVNEYKPQRFRNRMKKFDWVDYWNEDKPKFETIPVTDHHADYIKPNWLNVIDWIHIKGDFWDIATIIQDIQIQLRNGIAIIVIQKTGGKKMGIGGDWGKFFPAVYLTLDPPGKLTLIKVKSAPEGARNPEGKMFAFDIIDRGSKFQNIREVKSCPACKGRGYVFDRECPQCFKKGYIDV